MERTGVIIIAGGSGSRAGGARPKQFRFLDGMPVLARTINTFAAAILCSATSKRAERFFQNPMCCSGSTATISAPGSAAANVLIVRARTGMPSRNRNC